MLNLRTTLFGIAVIIVTAIGPVLDHYFPVVGMSWVAIMTSVAALLSGTGLILAKDASNQSTQAQVNAATAKSVAVTPEQVADAAVQGKIADKQAVGK